MLEKELRKMRRKELIEIIYAMKNREEELLQINEALEEELKAKEVPIEESSSIEEASQSLEKILKKARKATEAYMRFAQAQQNAAVLAETESEKTETLVSNTEKNT